VFLAAVRLVDMGKRNARFIHILAFLTTFFWSGLARLSQLDRYDEAKCLKNKEIAHKGLHYRKT